MAAFQDPAAAPAPARKIAMIVAMIVRPAALSRHRHGTGEPDRDRAPR